MKGDSDAQTGQGLVLCFVGLKMNEARVGMLVIGSEVGLTKSDKMIYVQLSEISHLCKIGIATNDLIGHKFACFVWKLPHQKSQAAR